MPTVTLSSKHQITLPMEAVRALSLKPGDKLVVLPMEWRIVIMKESETTVDRFVGSLKGVYGSTVEEIDRYIAEVRYGWDIDALKDALALDENLRKVYEATSSTEARSATDLAKRVGVDKGYVDKYLLKLETLDAIKRLEHPELKGVPYYRRIP